MIKRFRTTLLAALSGATLVAMPADLEAQRLRVRTPHVRAALDLDGPRLSIDFGDPRKRSRRGGSSRRYGRNPSRGRAPDHGHGQTHGHWETRCERVWIPGHHESVYVPARYGWVYDSCGRRSWCIVEPACKRQVWHEGYHETRNRRVWVQH